MNVQIFDAKENQKISYNIDAKDKNTHTIHITTIK